MEQGQKVYVVVDRDYSKYEDVVMGLFNTPKQAEGCKEMYKNSVAIKEPNRFMVLEDRIQGENPYKELCDDMYTWLDTYMQSKATIDKSHPVHRLLNEYEQLIKEEE